jgi:transketolase
MMTSLCLKAADRLAGQGVDAEVIHLASIKPIDGELILESTGRTGCGVTAENASIIGGFGDAVLEVVAEAQPVPLYRIGVRDQFVECGGIDELFTLHQMQPEHIAAAANKMIEKKRK